MVRGGVNVALGVDGAASNNGQDMLETMKFAALIHPAVGAGFLSSERIVEMATIDGARALGLEHEIGSLEVGKKADVTVIGRAGKPHLSPGLKPVSDVMFCANGSDVDTVIVDGQIVMQDRRFTTLDETEAMRRVGEIARRMVGEAGKLDLLRTPTFRYVDER
jgi:5-methylthioadenosine/S-adenosylhomocysteine deaminase